MCVRKYKKCSNMAHLNKEKLEEFNLDILNPEFIRIMECAKNCIEPKTGLEMAFFVEKNQRLQVEILYTVIRYDRKYYRHYQYHNIYVLCAAYMAIDKAFGYRTNMYKLLSSAHENKAYEDLGSMEMPENIGYEDWTKCGKYIMHHANFEDICVPSNITIYDTRIKGNKAIYNEFLKEKTGITINAFLYIMEDISCEKIIFLRHIFDFYIDDKHIDGHNKNTIEITKKDIIYTEMNYAKKLFPKINEDDMKTIIDIMFTVRYKWGRRGLTKYF